MLIEIICSGCQKELQVPEENRGMKGKCPNCNSIITVPEYSSDTLIFEEAALRCNNEKLQELYDYLINESSVPKLRHKISETKTGNDVIVLTVKTGKYKTRKHGLIITVIPDIPNEGMGEFVSIMTHIGSITDNDILPYLLAKNMQFVRIWILEGVIYMASEKLLKTCDEKEFSFLVNAVANYADDIEQELFGWDEV
jgi:hypothetical protein